MTQPRKDFILKLILFSLIVSTHTIHACVHTDRTSLLSFALTLSYPSLNWTSSNCCHWEGITCDRYSRVTRLQLPSKGLTLKEGIFPSSSLENLTHLTYLNLSHNSLNGYLNQTERFLPNDLEILDLSYNRLFGALPSSLPSSHIQMVDFSSNRLHGAIAPSIFQQALKLTSFNVSNNTFSGPIPSSSCLLSSTLRHLDFSFNNFNGSIPRGLGNCYKLQVFRAGYNYLSGLLPGDIYNATSLEDISLARNSLSGEISDKIVNLTNLIVLDLYDNQFTGVIPLHIGKFSNLQNILLDFNYLEGPLPQSLMNCTNLVEVRMGANNLEGDISMLNFSRLSQLGKLDIQKNNFSGTLPRSLYSCKYLKAIRMSYNNLEIQIHPEISSLKYLSFISLGWNKCLTNVTRALNILMGCESLIVLSTAASFLGEEIPADLGTGNFQGFRNLQVLDMSSCDLSGTIPYWISKLKNLQVLGINHNRITGSIPSWLGTLPNLYSINMEVNQLSGDFPKELCRLPMLVAEENAAKVDRKSTELPIYYRPGVDATTLQYNRIIYAPFIFLENNNLQGKLPAEIGQMKQLKVLDLSNNNFSGDIPKQISYLKHVEVIDLSMNHFSGEIPASFSSLHFLSRFNVSYNNLQGPIPSSTQLQSINASAFEGNPKLCGAPLLNECSITKGIDDNNHVADKKDQRIPWFYVSFALGFIVGFWGVCCSLVLKKKWRYVYFRFLDNVSDKLYVMIARRIDIMKRGPV